MHKLSRAKFAAKRLHSFSPADQPGGKFIDIAVARSNPLLELELLRQALCPSDGLNTASSSFIVILADVNIQRPLRKAATSVFPR